MFKERFERLEWVVIFTAISLIMKQCFGFKFVAQTALKVTGSDQCAEIASIVFVGLKTIKTMSFVIQFLEVLTIVLGLTAAIASLGISLYFFQSPVKIARAVAIDKLAESINMFVIFTFALFYWLDILSVMPILAAIALRMIAISATLFSTANLAIQTKRIDSI